MKKPKCGMCDWNVSNASKDAIPIANITGSVYKEIGNPPQELDFVTGRLSLEKSLYPLSFNVVVTVSGIDPNENVATVFVAKFPAKTCPKCGKALK